MDTLAIPGCTVDARDLRAELVSLLLTLGDAEALPDLAHREGEVRFERVLILRVEFGPSPTGAASNTSAHVRLSDAMPAFRAARADGLDVVAVDDPHGWAFLSFPASTPGTMADGAAASSAAPEPIPSTEAEAA